MRLSLMCSSFGQKMTPEKFVASFLKKVKSFNIYMVLHNMKTNKLHQKINI